MKTIKRLPDAEFELMKIVWRRQPPIYTSQIIGDLGADNQWKPQTVLTLLSRLVERGFLTSEKLGKERTYATLISEDVYLQAETANFMNKHYKNSVTAFVNTLYAGQQLSELDIEDLKKLLAKLG